MSRAVRRGRRERERGVTAVVVAIVITVIAGFAALVINVGHMMAIRGQLQGATDSAALAAAVELDGSAEGLELAKDAAVSYAGRHATDRGMSVVVRRDDDVIFGEWHFAARTFEPVAGTGPAELARINAVRVLAGREEARGTHHLRWRSPSAGCSGGRRPRCAQSPSRSSAARARPTAESRSRSPTASSSPAEKGRP